ATTARAAESTLTTNLAAEATRAGLAETANATAISTEATTARAAESTLTTNLAAEATRAGLAETANATAISAETTRATAAEATKEALVNKSTDVSTDGTSDTKYPSVKSVKTYVDVSATTASSALATETANRIAADNLKANLSSPTFTGTVSGIDKTMVGLSNVNNTSDANKPVSTAQQTALNLKAPLASPSFTGTVSGIDKTMVGLGNVDNTSDANKPVSTAQQTALNLKANLASPIFTGTVSGITSTMVGLGNVDNTSDLSKPVSTATQTVLNLKEDVVNKSTNVTTDGASDTKYPSVKSVKTYVDTQVTGISTPDATSSVKGKIQLAGDLSGTAAAPTIATVGSVTAANVASGANLANAATNANTVSTIVKRDASGNFSAGTITASLTGNATNVSGTVAAANGGTGITSYTVGDIPYASGATTLSKLADVATGSVLVSGGVGAAPVWGYPTIYTVSAISTLGTFTNTGYAGTIGGAGTLASVTVAQAGDYLVTYQGSFVNTTNNRSESIRLYNGVNNFAASSEMTSTTGTSIMTISTSAVFTALSASTVIECRGITSGNTATVSQGILIVTRIK
ncbi:hypothetical protein ACM55M_14860, partial [Flavobacterium sp. ZT3R25]|uniref:hypothetical protein n=1 Tax=Flavobacterium galactosi TaxID=3398735 RepID=UPI003A8BA0FE